VILGTMAETHCTRRKAVRLNEFQDFVARHIRSATMRRPFEENELAPARLPIPAPQPSEWGMTLWTVRGLLVGRVELDPLQVSP
jgi:hypothetical protein